MGDYRRVHRIEMFRVCMYPGGRYRSDGPYSGEYFREDCLVPKLKEDRTHVVVVLNSVLGLPSSFLEEAFGGLVRVNGFSESFLTEHLSFEPSHAQNRDALEEIWSYIKAAEAVSKEMRL